MYGRITLVNLTIVLLIFPIAAIEGTQPQWSSDITVKSYYWKASKSELRNLDTEEQYKDSYLIGGANIPGGGTSVSLMSEPPDDFDFFNGSRLDLQVVIEGDMVLELSQSPYDTDYHLFLLPIKVDNRSFFEVLFEEKRLLENLTRSVYLNSSIKDTKAIVFLKYDDILDIQYEWDTSSGILVRKEVRAPSGLQLIVIQGRASIGPGFNYSIILSAIFLGVLWQIKREKGKYVKNSL